MEVVGWAILGVEECEEGECECGLLRVRGDR